MSQTERLLEDLFDRFANAAAEHPAFNHVAAWSSVPTWPYTLTDLTTPADSPLRNRCERLGLVQRDWEEIIGRAVRERSGRHRTGCMNWLRFHGKLWEGRYLADCPEVAALRDSPLPPAAWIERLADPKNHRILTAHNAATKAALTVFLRLAREAAGLVGLVGLIGLPAEELCGNDPADRWLETVHDRVGRIETRDQGYEVSVLPENVFLASATVVSILIGPWIQITPKSLRAAFGQCHSWLMESWLPANSQIVEKITTKKWKVLYPALPPDVQKKLAKYAGNERPDAGDDDGTRGG